VPSRKNGRAEIAAQHFADAVSARCWSSALWLGCAPRVVGSSPVGWGNVRRSGCHRHGDVFPLCLSSTPGRATTRGTTLCRCCVRQGVGVHRAGWAMLHSRLSWQQSVGPCLGWSGRHRHCRCCRGNEGWWAKAGRGQQPRSSQSSGCAFPVKWSGHVQRHNTLPVQFGKVLGSLSGLGHAPRVVGSAAAG
jgi:hypothetical protein